MTDLERRDRNRVVTLALTFVGGACVVGALVGAVGAGLLTLAQWMGDAEWELT